MYIYREKKNNADRVSIVYVGGGGALDNKYTLSARYTSLEARALSISKAPKVSPVVKLIAYRAAVLYTRVGLADKVVCVYVCVCCCCRALFV